MIRALAELRLRNWLQVVNESVIRPVKMLSMEPAGVRLWRLGWSLLCVPTLSTIIEPMLMVYSPDALIFILLEAPLLIYAQHGLSVTQSGLAFLAVHIGNWIGLLCFPVQRALEYRAIRKKGGERSPEVTLTWGFLAAFLLPISLCFYSCRRPR